MTTQTTFKRRIRARMLETGENYTTARAALLAPESVSTDGPSRVQAVVLKINARSARVRVLGEVGELTFRGELPLALVPGHLVELSVAKRWTHAGHGYASGTFGEVRVDVEALGLEPLPLQDEGWRDLNEIHDPVEDPDRYAPLWREVTAELRPSYSFHRIAWLGSGAGEESPAFTATRRASRGDVDTARALLMAELHAELRYLDAHAHLGNLEFELRPRTALAHYELGIRIGALSLPDDPDLLLPWGITENRPYLRCMAGYGMTLWRLERRDEAAAVFERMIRLNPNDNQGARFMLFAVLDGRSWEEWSAAEEATLAP